jgi:hypothetical protein
VAAGGEPVCFQDRLPTPRKRGAIRVLQPDTASGSRAMLEREESIAPKLIKPLRPDGHNCYRQRTGGVHSGEAS